MRTFISLVADLLPTFLTFYECHRYGVAQLDQILRFAFVVTGSIDPAIEKNNWNVYVVSPAFCWAWASLTRVSQWKRGMLPFSFGRPRGLYRNTLLVIFLSLRTKQKRDATLYPSRVGIRVAPPLLL